MASINTPKKMDNNISEPNIFSILVADDEPLARDRLVGLISKNTRLKLAAVAKNGEDAVIKINCQNPDIVILDVKMPFRSGLSVSTAIDTHPIIIFSTAFSSHAVKAFEIGALDYILKPYSAKRFDLAINRAIDSLTYTNNLRAEQMSLVNYMLKPQSSTNHIFVRKNNLLERVDFANIHYAQANDDYVLVQSSGIQHLASIRLYDLEQLLDPSKFVRIHRSYIVNLDYVDSVKTLTGGRMELTLKNGEKLFSSRAGTRKLKNHKYTKFAFLTSDYRNKL